MSRTELQTLPERAVAAARRSARRHDAPSVSPRSPRRRRRRARAARGRPRHSLDQDDLQGVGARQDHRAHRPDDPRGRRHPGQGALARGEGAESGRLRPDVPARGGGVRLRRHGAARRRGARLSARRPRRRGSERRSRRDRVPERPRLARHQARRHRRGGRPRRRRDRHGHRSRGFPLRPLRSSSSTRSRASSRPAVATTAPTRRSR